MAKLIAKTVCSAQGASDSGSLIICGSFAEPGSPEFFDEQASDVKEVLSLLPAETLNRIQTWLAGRFVPAKGSVEEVKVSV